MNSNTIYLSGVALATFVCLAVVAVGSFLSFQAAGAQTTGPAAQSCVASSTLVSIGHQFANPLVGSTSRRSWLVIQNIPNATNTVFLALNDVRPTTGTPWFVISPATTSSPVTDFRFGLNSDLQYTGAVRGITNAGTSTVIVTECIY